MFHGSCRKVSKVLSMALEPISKSAVHYLARKVSEIRVAKEPRYRWAFERLGLEYKHERFGLRNRVERFFRYLKERTAVFHLQAKRKKRHTGDHKPQTIPNPIHTILSGCEDREVSENTYLDTICKF
jgi:hypothetical protein